MFDIGLDLQKAFDEGYEKGKVSRPQGEWIEMYRNGFGNMICMCSKCNFHATKSNFCPNCGAHMKGLNDEED